MNKYLSLTLLTSQEISQESLRKTGVEILPNITNKFKKANPLNIFVRYSLVILVISNAYRKKRRTVVCVYVYINK